MGGHARQGVGRDKWHACSLHRSDIAVRSDLSLEDAGTGSLGVYKHHQNDIEQCAEEAR
jgi:hypothetical protein